MAKFSRSGDKLLYLTEIVDSGTYDSLGGMTVLADGSVLLAGGTRSLEFPTTEAGYQPKATKGGAFLLKFDPSGQKLVFSTFLDDSVYTGANALAAGPDGSIYLAGETDGTTFPTTDGAYQRTRPAGSNTTGFVSRFSADGRKLLYSTLFGDSPLSVIGVDHSGAIHLGSFHSLSVLDAVGSRLLFSRNFGFLQALQIDAAGNSYAYAGGLLVKFDPTGVVLFEKPVPNIYTRPTGIVVLDSGGILLAGGAFDVNFQTRNTLQPCNTNLFHESVPVQWWILSAALVVLDPSGNLVNSSFMGGPAPPSYGNDGNGFGWLAKGPDGTVVIAGSSSSPDFPGGPVIIPGNPNRATFAFTLDFGAFPLDRKPVPACLALSATQNLRAVEAPVVPAMFMSLYGSGFGPAVPTYSQLDVTQSLPTELAGTSLKVGGIPAPILSVQDGQIDFIVPHEITGPTTDVCVSRDGTEACLFSYVGDRDGTILSGVLNEDGTVNSSANPAAGGSVVSVFGIGFGIFDPATPDGALAANPFSADRYSFHATLMQTLGRNSFSAPADVLYVGSAPRLLNGVVQINFRIWNSSGMTTVDFQSTGKIPAYPLRIPRIVVFVKTVMTFSMGL